MNQGEGEGERGRGGGGGGLDYSSTFLIVNSCSFVCVACLCEIGSRSLVFSHSTLSCDLYRLNVKLMLTGWPLLNQPVILGELGVEGVVK